MIPSVLGMTGIRLTDEKMLLAPFFPSVQKTNDVSKIQKTAPPCQVIFQKELFRPPGTGRESDSPCSRGGDRGGLEKPLKECAAQMSKRIARRIIFQRKKKRTISSSVPQPSSPASACPCRPQADRRASSSPRRGPEWTYPRRLSSAFRWDIPTNHS